MRGSRFLDSQERVLVGASGLFGTGIGADLYKEMDDINLEMERENRELFEHFGKHASFAPFYSNIWAPFYDQWRTFAHDNTTTFARAKNALSIALAENVWRDQQAFREQLGKLDEAAKSVGFKSQGPAPSSPHTNVAEDAYHKASDAAGSVATFVKWVAIGGLTLVGAVVITSLASNIKRGSDPVASYWAMGQGTRRRKRLAT